MSLTEELLYAFEGFSGAHGQTEVSNQRMNGKQKAKSFIVRQPLTLELMQGHIDGVKGVGAIPINEKNQCKFGALDIDEYPLDHKQLVDKLDKLKVRVSCAVVKVGVHTYSFSLQSGWKLPISEISLPR